MEVITIDSSDGEEFQPVNLLTTTCSFPSSSLTSARPSNIESELLTINEEFDQVQSQIDELVLRRSELDSLRRSLLDSLETNNVDFETLPDTAADWSKDDFEWSKTINQLAMKHWGISSFRHNQLAAINAHLGKRDVYVVAPTGGGKSLCYQLPALFNAGISLVISPLISLIVDQVEGLRDVGIEAGSLTSHTSKEDTKRIMDSMLDSKSSLKLVYVTPEKIAKSKRFMNHLEKVYRASRLSGIILDEAHCCSSLGHDFRPDYKKLGILRTVFARTPIMCLSATTPPSILLNVFQILHLRPHNVPNGTILLTSPLDRPNLVYSVKTKNAQASVVVKEISEFISTKYPNDRGIIYCLSRKDCETLAQELLKTNVRVGVYHSDMQDSVRESVQLRWRRGEILCVIATIAFGLGINQPNVRYVMHHSLSKSVEGYYQESGRAGRDGKAAECVLYWRAQDMFRISSMVVSDSEGLRGCYAMARYAFELSSCRRISMIKHFGQADGRKSNDQECGKCDNCARKESGIRTEDVTALTLDLCKILHALREEDGGKVTLIKLVDAWKGIGLGKKVASVVNLQASAPKRLSRDELERIIVVLVCEKYIKEDFHFTPYSTVSYITLATRGERLLQSEGKNNSIVLQFAVDVAASKSPIKRKKISKTLLLSDDEVIVASNKKKKVAIDLDDDDDDFI